MPGFESDKYIVNEGEAVIFKLLLSCSIQCNGTGPTTLERYLDFQLTTLPYDTDHKQSLSSAIDQKVAMETVESHDNYSVESPF